MESGCFSERSGILSVFREQSQTRVIFGKYKAMGNPMEIFSLICFVTLTEYMNFSEAADSLFLSQSAFSKRINDIERELGVRLFIRNSRNCMMSEVGKAILPYAQDIISEYKKAKSNLKLSDSKQLTISTHSFLVHYNLSDMLMSFQEASPNIELVVIESDSCSSLEKLRSGQVDACIVFLNGEELNEFDILPLSRDRLALFVGRQHGFSNRKTIHLSELRDEIISLLHQSQEPFLHSFIIKQFKRFGFEPQIRSLGLWIDSIEDILLKGNYITILPIKLMEYPFNPHISQIPLAGSDDLLNAIVTRKSEHNKPLLSFMHYAMGYAIDESQK